MHVITQVDLLVENMGFVVAVVMYCEHRQVIALLGTIDKSISLFMHGCHQYRGRGLALFQARLSSVDDPLQAEQVVIGVGCLGQAVGIEQQCGFLRQLMFLQNILEIFNHTQRQIGIHWQSYHATIEDEWSIVAGIAITQTARRQVKNADEHGDEHIGLVAVAGGLVDARHDACWVALVLGQTVEQGVYYCHHKR